MQIVPTLNIGGNCREAIQKEYIYHSELVLDNQRIIMADHLDIEFQTCYSNFLTIMFDTKEEVQRAYEIMKAGFLWIKIK